MTDGVHKLGEVLRTAREAKGVDLVRVERETKIRERYLSALERGEYRELPGAVYTKGFLRNYGAYLGLDPEYLIDLYRLETSDVRPERASAPAPPKPLAVRRARAFVVTPGAISAAILTLAVGAFLAYLGYQLVNFAREPTLRITEPPGTVTGYRDDRITIRGVTEPNARVTVSNLRENPTVTADAAGRFEVTVELVPGSNVVELVARDPVTNRDTAAQQRTIVVADEVAASPSANPVTLELETPVDGTTVAGAVEIAGRATPGTSVTIGATAVAAPTPAFAITDAGGTPVDLEAAAPPDPEPVSVEVGAEGTFGATLELRPGRWQIAVDAGDAAVTRTVAVGQRDGLAARVRIDGGDSYVELWQDGEAVAGRSGTIATDGQAIDLAAEDELRIRAGNAGVVSLTVNGVSIGAMGESGAIVEWVIRPVTP